MKLPEFVIETVSIIAGAKAASDTGDPSAGHAVSEFVNNRLHGLANQFSSQRQSKRITEVTQYALDGIKCRLENGETLRDDVFFTRMVDRCYAEETLESVMLKARDEFEEKKIPYLAKLFENACFDTQIHPGLLHFLCKEFESLTYRQLCIIKMIIENKYPLSLKSVVETPSLIGQPVPLLSHDSMPTLVECVSLGYRGYIEFEQSPPDNTRSGTVALLVPHSMRYSVPAAQMYGRMGLGSIPEGDVLPLAKSLG